MVETGQNIIQKCGLYLPENVLTVPYFAMNLIIDILSNTTARMIFSLSH